MNQKEKEQLAMIVGELQAIEENARGCFETSRSAQFNWIADDAKRVRTKIVRVLLADRGN